MTDSWTRNILHDFHTGELVHIQYIWWKSFFPKDLTALQLLELFLQVMGAIIILGFWRFYWLDNVFGIPNKKAQLPPAPMKKWRKNTNLLHSSVITNDNGVKVLQPPTFPGHFAVFACTSHIVNNKRSYYYIFWLPLTVKAWDRIGNYLVWQRNSVNHAAWPRIQIWIVGCP